MKTIIYTLLLSFLLISCVPTLSDTETIAPTSTIFWITPSISLSPQPTITPEIIEPYVIKNNTVDISNIIVQVYSIKPECAHSVFIDDPELITKVNFLDAIEPNALDARWVQAISYSPDKRRQASIVCTASSLESQGCSDHIFIKDESSSDVFEIEVDGHLATRPFFNITWIGNDIIAFIENSSPQVDTIFAIDLTKKEYLYYSIYYGQCK